MCHLAAQVYYALAYLKVVLCIVLGADGVFSHIHLAAQLAVVGMAHERTVAGEVECEYPAVLPRLLGCLCRSLTCCVGQSAQVVLVCYVQRECLVFLQHVLLKLQCQHAHFLSELAQLCLACFIKQGTASHQSVVARVQQPLLFSRQPAVVQVYSFNALKHLFVQAHVVGVLCQYGLHLFCQCVQFVAGLGTVQVVEHVAHTVKQVIVMVGLALVVENYGIVERWLVRIVYDFVERFLVAPYAFHKGFLKIAYLYLVKWHGVVRRAIIFKKRVHSLYFFFFRLNIAVNDL